MLAIDDGLLGEELSALLLIYVMVYLILCVAVRRVAEGDLHSV